MRTELTSGRLAIAVSLSCLAAAASAQTIGTFRWQQQPYCNVVTVTVTQVGAIYRLEGTDDQCGATRLASASGIAFPNPDGTIGMGLAVVTTDGSTGGTPLHIDATISLAALSGTWRDSTGASGAWEFTPGSGTTGNLRPIPSLSFPGGVSVGGGAVRDVASPTTGTDAANKDYVDTSARAVRSMPVPLSGYSAARKGNLNVDSWGCVDFDTAASSSIKMDLPLPEGASLTAVRVKYMHWSTASAPITFRIHFIDFDDNGFAYEDYLANSLNSSSGSTGNRAETIVASPVPPAVSSSRSYYLSGFAGAHTGLLAFCGATAFYTLP